MKDRIPTYPGRVKLTPVAGQANVYDMVRADEPIEAGTPLNKATLLADQTATALGLDLETATPDKAFGQVLPLYPNVGDLMQTHGEAPDDHWLKLVSGGTTYITAETLDLYNAIPKKDLAFTTAQELGSTELISTQPISMGYMNGYWYELADNNYDKKLAFKKDTEGSDWNIVAESDFTIPEDERGRLYYTRDLIYFDGKYFISGSGTIFESTDLKKWTISNRVYNADEYSGKLCDRFHISFDGNILYGCFTGNGKSRIAWKEKGGAWNISGDINMSIYEVFMKPDKTMLAFGTEIVYTSPAIDNTNYIQLCIVNENIDYAEYIDDLQCYIVSSYGDSTRQYYVVENFDESTTNQSFTFILNDFQYPESPNIFYDPFNKIVWTLGNTGTSSNTSYIYYKSALSFEDLKTSNTVQINDAISVNYMYLARVRPKDTKTIFVKRTSSGNAFYELLEFAKTISITERYANVYILAYDLRYPVPLKNAQLFGALQPNDDVYTELAKAIREGVNSI